MSRVWQTDEILWVRTSSVSQSLREFNVVNPLEPGLCIMHSSTTLCRLLQSFAAAEIGTVAVAATAATIHRVWAASSNPASSPVAEQVVILAFNCDSYSYVMTMIPWPQFHSVTNYEGRRVPSHFLPRARINQWFSLAPTNKSHQQTHKIQPDFFWVKKKKKSWFDDKEVISLALPPTTYDTARIFFSNDESYSRDILF